MSLPVTLTLDNLTISVSFLMSLGLERGTCIQWLHHPVQVQVPAGYGPGRALRFAPGDSVRLK